jgi:hypothetical protein
MLRGWVGLILGLEGRDILRHAQRLFRERLGGGGFRVRLGGGLGTVGGERGEGQ